MSDVEFDQGKDLHGHDGCAAELVSDVPADYQDQISAIRRWPLWTGVLVAIVVSLGLWGGILTLAAKFLAPA